MKDAHFSGGYPHFCSYRLTHSDQAVDGHVCKGSAKPNLKGRNPRAPLFLVPPTNAHVVWPRKTEVGIVRHVREGRVLESQPHHCTLHKCVARFVSDGRVSCFIHTSLHATLPVEPYNGMATFRPSLCSARAEQKVSETFIFYRNILTRAFSPFNNNNNNNVAITSKAP